MFESFVYRQIQTSKATINLALAGSGPPVLLLHGYPQTHACWHRISPALSEHFTVVCPDLRGYGDSAKPPGDPDHHTYSKRSLAQDQVEVMADLGFETFAVVGHDRGARVAHRMALDYPEKVSRLALLDIIPTASIYASLNQDRAMNVWRYFFLTQPYDLPERLIGARAEFYLSWTLEHWAGTRNAFAPEALAEYRRCFDAATIHASCEDYRAGATIDLIHDTASQAQKIACPLLVLWSERGLGSMYDVQAIWHEYAKDVRGRALPCGHFLAEEQPEEVTSQILAFCRPKAVLK